jgi:hypothetical protein
MACAAWSSDMMKMMLGRPAATGAGVMDNSASRAVTVGSGRRIPNGLPEREITRAGGL